MVQVVHSKKKKKHTKKTKVGEEYLGISFGVVALFVFLFLFFEKDRFFFALLG